MFLILQHLYIFQNREFQVKFQYTSIFTQLTVLKREENIMNCLNHNLKYKQALNLIFKNITFFKVEFISLNSFELTINSCLSEFLPLLLHKVFILPPIESWIIYHMKSKLSYAIKLFRKIIMHKGKFITQHLKLNMRVIFIILNFIT